jgi:hypothetical protein
VCPQRLAIFEKDELRKIPLIEVVGRGQTYPFRSEKVVTETNPRNGNNPLRIHADALGLCTPRLDSNQRSDQQ